MEVGLRLGVSQQAVRRGLATAGATIRPSGRRAKVSVLTCRVGEAQRHGDMREVCVRLRRARRDRKHASASKGTGRWQHGGGRR